jgi:hypothetical protein
MGEAEVPTAATRVDHAAANVRPVVMRGMDVWRTAVVRDSDGHVIRRETFHSAASRGSWSGME